MDYIVIMPTYNEENFLHLTLKSIAQQIHLPKALIIVNDNSNDNTLTIAKEFCLSYNWASVVTTTSQQKHLPGSKVIQAFNFGLDHIDKGLHYDYIVKLDADLILPKDYFSTLTHTFMQSPETGMVGGFAYIEKNNTWILENLTDKDHIRGAFKAYRRACFEQIGGLKTAMGWDTVDELLARFYNWEIITIPELKIKHLKPTGAQYDRSARYKQGEAFYTLDYGILITLIAASKLALRKNKPFLVKDYLWGYYQAKKNNIPPLVTKEQGVFIRRHRFSRIKEKFKKYFF